MVLDETPNGEQSGVAKRDDGLRISLEFLERLLLRLDELIDLGGVALNGRRRLVGRAPERDVGKVVGFEVDEIDPVAA